MTLHIFNPEHDVALASNLANFTAPHAARQLRSDLGWLPALWAKDGDFVMVDNVEQAERAWRRLCNRVKTLGGSSAMTEKKCSFLSMRKPLPAEVVTAVDPWGWDKALCDLLRRRGLPPGKMPSATRLEAIRQLSHRRMAALLLSNLKREGTVGKAIECQTEQQVADLLERFGHIVIKQPWSSSGRGLRFLRPDSPQTTIQNWLRNVIAAQGSVMVEPYYNKVKDFAMEFFRYPDGTVSYLGLSLFTTQAGAYQGNVIAPESMKEQMLARYFDIGLLDSVRKSVIEWGSTNRLMREAAYSGPFGVDMMACQGGLLHPCVEINLRRTMGHVALLFEPLLNTIGVDDKIHEMHILMQNNNYKLKIHNL